MYKITLLPSLRVLQADPGENLLTLLRKHSLAPDAPCGGQGTCGKCDVLVNSTMEKSCQVVIDSDLTVTLPEKHSLQILMPETDQNLISNCSDIFGAFDIGTTTIVFSLLDSTTGKRLAVKAVGNPQSVYGADVVSRIRSALSGSLSDQSKLVQNTMTTLIKDACQAADISPDSVKRICVVGNPAMQQLFLGISPRNLVDIPFHPVLTEAKELPCRNYLPICPDAALQIVPDIAGYIGADTVGCLLATGMHKKEVMQLLVDIGTNGEMVLGNQERLVACATAAGPALEGANIRFGMRACDGAIDHVWLENGAVRFSTVGGGNPAGICGSGLIDAVAAFLDLGKINARGRIAPGMELDGERILSITDQIYLTQEDIRQVQLAKGAICAGIRMMMDEMGFGFEDIDSCLLAGGFGTYLNPKSARRIGLLPPELLEKVCSVGNTAAEGAEMMAMDTNLFRFSEQLAAAVEPLELSSLPEFPKAYAAAMRF